MARALRAFLACDIASFGFLITGLLVFAGLLLSAGPFGLRVTMFDAFSIPLMWGDASMLLGLSAGFCASQNLVRDRDRRTDYYYVIRCSKRNYYVARYISCFASTSLSFFLALLAYAVVCCVTTPMFTYPGDIENELLAGPFIGVIYAGMPVLWVLCVALVTSIGGGVLGAIGMTAALFLQSRVVAISSPLIILTLVGSLWAALSLPEWGNLQSLLECSLVSGDTLITLGAYACAYSVWGLCISAVFAIGCKRWISNE